MATTRDGLGATSARRWPGPAPPIETEGRDQYCPHCPHRHVGIWDAANAALARAGVAERIDHHPLAAQYREALEHADDHRRGLGRRHGDGLARSGPDVVPVLRGKDACGGLTVGRAPGPEAPAVANRWGPLPVTGRGFGAESEGAVASLVTSAGGADSSDKA